MVDKLPPDKKPLTQTEGGEEVKNPLSAGDLATLDAFCEGISFDDMDFEAWGRLHRNLNLTLPLALSAEEARHGGERAITYVRAISELAPGGGVSERRKERVNRKIRWPANLQKDYVITLAGEGDRHGEAAGNLQVILRVPKGPRG